MTDFNKINNDIIKNNKELVTDIQGLLDKFTAVITQNTKNYIDDIAEYLKDYNRLDAIVATIKLDTIDDYFKFIHNIELISDILALIHNKIDVFLDKTQNSETYLSQSFITDTFESHKKILVVYNKYTRIHIERVREIIIAIINKEKNDPTVHANPLKYTLHILDLYQTFPFAIDLLTSLLACILENLHKWQPDNKFLYYTITTAIETEKNHILENIQKVKSVSNSTLLLNPYYNTFGLIPNTNSIPIDQIAQLIYNKPAKTLSEFTKLCKDANHGIVVFNKHINYPITYNSAHLLNMDTSLKFQQIHKPNYGVDIPILHRYKTIDKIDAKNKWDYTIETYVYKFNDYEKEKNQFIIILDSISPGFYRILTNFVAFNNKYFVRISTVRELYLHIIQNKELYATRIGNYNNLIIKKATDVMFAPVKVNMEKIKTISTIVDPKYLRNQIYLRLLDEFKEILGKKYKNGKSITDNYTYASIVHNEQFLNIYADIITEEFYAFLYSSYTEYVSGYLNLSEVLASFQTVLFINRRTFIKEMHDYFKDNLLVFAEDNPTNFILMHFDTMIQTVLNKLITPDSNIYQNVLYKINLLKDSLV